MAEHRGHEGCCLREHLRARRLTGSIIVAALAIPVAAADARSRIDDERGDLLSRFVERERTAHVGALPTIGPPAPPRPPSTLDAISTSHDITIDPASGTTEATLALRVKATGGALRAVSVSFDQGLTLDQATADARRVSAADGIFAPSRVVELTLDPPLAAGEETVLTLAYSGTLACAPKEGGAVACRKDASFAFFSQSSIFPFVFDPAAPADIRFDGMTREVVLRVPAGNDVVISGHRVSETHDAERTTSRWLVDRPLSRPVGIYALVGQLGRKPVPTRSGSASFVFPQPGEPIDDALAEWSSVALDFVERDVGAPLPFVDGLSLVRLPKALGDPGTATFGMTLLSDSYQRLGDVLYEETWAHENSHLFWGIVVPETNSSESRLMTEGMATLTELEYTHARHFRGEDRDAYLARRFVPIGLDIRAHPDVPPIRVTPEAELTGEFRGPTYMLWAYYKTAATLDHLRVSIGEEKFARALADYRERCTFRGCSPSTFQEIASKASGKDLGSFFERWSTASERPRVTIAFEPTPSGADVTLTKEDERPLTLELWLGLEDGSRVKERVDLGGRTSRVPVVTAEAVRSVQASPRHDVLVDVRSAVAHDLDFDGEVDGFDVLRCARLVGSSYASRGATGLFDIFEAGTSFDPRCDVDENGTIDDADLSRVTTDFGARSR